MNTGNHNQRFRKRIRPHAIDLVFSVTPDAVTTFFFPVIFLLSFLKTFSKSSKRSNSVGISIQCVRSLPSTSFSQTLESLEVILTIPQMIFSWINCHFTQSFYFFPWPELDCRNSVWNTPQTPNFYRVLFCVSVSLSTKHLSFSWSAYLMKRNYKL